MLTAHCGCYIGQHLFWELCWALGTSSWEAREPQHCRKPWCVELICPSAGKRDRMLHTARQSSDLTHTHLLQTAKLIAVWPVTGQAVNAASSSKSKIRSLCFNAVRPGPCSIAFTGAAPTDLLQNQGWNCQIWNWPFYFPMITCKKW